MSGHSKWAMTKHRKAVIDAKRDKLFARLIKSMEVAARLDDGDPDGDPTLYDTTQKAKKSSVPSDNTDHTMRCGSGAISGGADYETIIYEAYGPSGIVIPIECLTDNRNRPASDVCAAVIRDGGTMADVGPVQRLLIRKGVVMVPKQQESREITGGDLFGAALEVGLEEVNGGDEAWEAVCDPGDTVEVREVIEVVGLNYDSSEMQFVVSFGQDVDTVELAQKVLHITDALGGSDDVQNVLTSLNLTSEMVVALDSED